MKKGSKPAAPAPGVTLADVEPLLGRIVSLRARFAGAERVHVGRLNLAPGSGLTVQPETRGCPPSFVPLSAVVTVFGIDASETERARRSVAAPTETAPPFAEMDGPPTPPEGKRHKQTWHQWCNGAGHDTDDKSGAAWDAFSRGVKAPAFAAWRESRAEVADEARAESMPPAPEPTPAASPTVPDVAPPPTPEEAAVRFFVRELGFAGYRDRVQTGGVVDECKVRRACNALMGRAASDRPEPTVAEYREAGRIAQNSADTFTKLLPLECFPSDEADRRPVTEVKEAAYAA